MKKTKKHLLLITSLLMLCACSNGPDSGNSDSYIPELKPLPESVGANPFAGKSFKETNPFGVTQYDFDETTFIHTVTNTLGSEKTTTLKELVKYSYNTEKGILCGNVEKLSSQTDPDKLLTLSEYADEYFENYKAFMIEMLEENGMTEDMISLALKEYEKDKDKILKPLFSELNLRIDASYCFNKDGDLIISPLNLDGAKLKDYYTDYSVQSYAYKHGYDNADPISINLAYTMFMFRNHEEDIYFYFVVSDITDKEIICDFVSTMDPDITPEFLEQYGFSEQNTKIPYTDTTDGIIVTIKGKDYKLEKDNSPIGTYTLIK